MIVRQTTKELLAESLKELSAHKPIDKITIREIVQNRDFLKNFVMHTSGQDSFINYVAQFNTKILSNYI